jgi:hypothetical protein
MTTFFVCQPPTPPLLLRRTGAATDEAFLHGTWQPTKIIIDFMFGHEDNVTGPISEQDARALVPAAFA